MDDAWTAEDDFELRRSLNCGTTLETIAAMLKRDPESIRRRLRERGQDDEKVFPRTDKP